MKCSHARCGQWPALRVVLHRVSSGQTESVRVCQRHAAPLRERPVTRAWKVLEVWRVTPVAA